MEEDPDNEFGAGGGEEGAAGREGPRIINVGVPGPGLEVALWRRAWRDKVPPCPKPAVAHMCISCIEMCKAVFQPLAVVVRPIPKLRDIEWRLHRTSGRDDEALYPHHLGLALLSCLCRGAQILPALVKFKPDLILISAGFDAHKKDDINFRYIGIQEKEYEWLTDQIIQVANRSGVPLLTLLKHPALGLECRSSHSVMVLVQVPPGAATTQQALFITVGSLICRFDRCAGAARGGWCRRWRAGTVSRGVSCRPSPAASRRTCAPWRSPPPRPGTLPTPG